MHRRLAAAFLILACLTQSRVALAANAYISAFPTLGSVGATDTFPDCATNSCNSGTQTNRATTLQMEGGLGTNPCTPIVLTDGANVAINLGSTCNKFTLLLSGTGHTLSNPTNATVGEVISLLISQPSSGGPDTFLFAADYQAPGGQQFTASLNTSASAVTEVDCRVIAATPTLYCYGPVAAAATTTTYSTPTNPNSTSLFTMQGMAGTCTPAIPGASVVLYAQGTIVQTALTTAAIGVTWKIAYGTGTAPTTNAAATGNVAGPTFVEQEGSTYTAGSPHHNFYSIAILAPATLTIGTAYWIDLQAESIGTISDTGFQNGSLGCFEIR